MKVLTLDIETSPHLAHVWRLWQENVSTVQIRESSTVLCVSWKWRGSKEIHFARAGSLHEIHDALDRADVVCGWNTDRFDLPHLNREFLLAGLGCPSPYRSVDLLKAVRRQFKFASNKLDYVAKELLGTGKVSHQGHLLWVGCMADDPKAWATMERYNKRDVRITEKILDKIEPWIPGFPHTGLYDAEDPSGLCACGSSKTQKRGFAYTSVTKYQRYYCLSCGRWSRGNKAISRVDVR